MPLLSADDVHYKTFTPTKFREGYDQDEVDEFLDQVVFTIQSLEERVGTGEPLPAATQPAPVVDGGDEAHGQLRAEYDAANERIAQLEAEKQQLQAELDEARRAVQQAPAPTSTGSTEEASSMLAMAQRVHDEYVRDGEQEGNRIVGEARAQGEQIIREANDEAARVLDKLETERGSLQSKVDDLKQFEREYRTQLRSHLESLIQNVDAGAGN
ncbi:DivIVA domain-containing protein [Nanchangia anserum]|uniref:Cell wall synthesis protein Wag31 n=2 Tax=Nanchangia anserum TaxID=2692125 RepID=A0A8I0KSC1_9ACTO|nr:DivIVA domain-containing protein [Nanchangia anserum]MBD3690232.1 DivIVA domain-containing protein [Nanchangia anserum]QOX82581.1 DivIVA domain-containing protein [Nanchangia anserum]